MPDGDPVLMQQEDTGKYGLYYPDEDVIETYGGDERVLVDESHPEEAWQEADAAELRASLEADIAEVREEIEDLRPRDLSDEQAQELDRIESRLDAQENTLKLVQKVADE